MQSFCFYIKFLFCPIFFAYTIFDKLEDKRIRNLIACKQRRLTRNVFCVGLFLIYEVIDGMSFEPMITEYEKSLKIIRTKILSLKEEIKTCRNPHRSHSLKIKICEYYEIQNDLSFAIAMMKKYDNK